MSKKKIKKTEESFNPYAVDKFATISASFKINFLKFWLAGATFYIVVLGIVSTRFDYLDRIVILVLILTLGFEYIVHTLIYWMDKEDSPVKQYLPHHVNRKSIFSLLATAVYVTSITVVILLFLEFWIEVLKFPTIGDILNDATADPFTFGLLFLLFDYIYLKIKQLIIKKVVKKHD
jgi:hypothetical protein